MPESNKQARGNAPAQAQSFCSLLLNPYNPHMEKKHKELLNLGIATVVGTTLGVVSSNLGLGIAVGIMLGIGLSFFNKPGKH